MIDINKLASRFYMVTGSSFKTITTKMKVYFLPLFGNILSLFTYNYLNVCVIYSYNYLLYPLFNLRFSISKSLARFWLNDYYLFQKHTKMTIEVLTPHDLITLKDTIINEVIDKVQNNLEKTDKLTPSRRFRLTTPMPD